MSLRRNMKYGVDISLRRNMKYGADISLRRKTDYQLRIPAYREVKKMKHFRNTAVVIAGALILALLATACGGRTSLIAETTAASASAMNYQAKQMGAAPAAREEAAYAGDEGYGMNSMATMDMVAETAASGASFSAGNLNEADAAALQDGKSGEKKAFGKLIRNIYVAIETEKFDNMTATIRERVTSLGGYLESVNEYSDYNKNRSCYMNARIPADRLDEFMNTALTEGTITNRSENVQDITLTYSDIETRLETLKVEQERLLELLGKAEDVDAIIAIETRLGEISYEIENNASRLKVYDNQVTYSTVSMDIREVDLTADTVEAGLGEKILTGIENNLVDVVSFVGALLFAIVIHLPFLIVLALVILLIVFLVKKVRKSHREKKAKKAAKAAAKETAAPAVTVPETTAPANAASAATAQTAEAKAAPETPAKEDAAAPQDVSETEEKPEQ